MTINVSVLKAHGKLREAIELAGGDATIAIMAPEPVASAFREYVEVIRLNAIDHEKLQTHFDDEVKRLDQEAKP